MQGLRLLCLSYIIFLSILLLSSSHSWLDCVDYDPQTDQCRGRPRNWYKRPATPFARDVGRDIRPGKDVPEGLFCDTQKEGINSPVSAGYDSQSPMAKVAPGQKVTMTWPAKNHANVGEQRGVQVFISSRPGVGDDFSHITSKAEWLTRYPELSKTFSNCNPNRSGVDAAFCQGEYTVPDDLPPGVYTFMWWWEFNPGEFYNSCADVEISGSTGNPGSNPTSNPQTGSTTSKPGDQTTPRPTSMPTPMPTPRPSLPPCQGIDQKTNSCPGGHDCTRDHNCCGSGKKCYHKDLYYAGCLSVCSGPGFMNPSDPPEFKTPWTCNILSSDEVVGITCTDDGNNGGGRDNTDCSDETDGSDGSGTGAGSCFGNDSRCPGSSETDCKQLGANGADCRWDSSTGTGGGNGLGAGGNSGDCESKSDEIIASQSASLTMHTFICLIANALLVSHFLQA